MTALFYLQELRKRLSWCLATWLACVAPLMYWANDVYHHVAYPLLTRLPQGSHLIATQVTSSFTTPLQLACIVSLWLMMPVVLYHIWAFITPALYPKEKRILLPMLLCSITLFYIGLLFGFFVICPMALSFFILFTPTGVTVMTDIQSYLDFVLSVVLACGLAFQVPIITWVSLQVQLVTVTQLKASRPYIIIAAFVLGMLLTPPDVVSQILLALPLWGLFELGLGLYALQHQ